MASKGEVQQALPNDYARIQRITDEIQRLADSYNRKLAVVERLNLQLETAKTLERRWLADQEVEEKAQVILLKLEEIWRKNFESGIENVVTEGLNLVFGTNDAFVLTTKVERGASAIEFSIETPTATVAPDDKGGSTVQVISFLLRVILLKAARPALRQVIILDEGFNALDENMRPQVGVLVRKIIEESGIQVILVAHERELVEYADIIYEIRSEKGVSSLHRMELAQ